MLHMLKHEQAFALVFREAFRALAHLLVASSLLACVD